MRFLGRKKFWWLAISALIMIPGIISLFVYKLPLGIDFKGGALLQIQFSKPVSEDALRGELAKIQEAKGATVSNAGKSNEFFVKTLPISEADHRKITDSLKKDFGNLNEEAFQSVGPSVSAELARKAIIALVAASLAIILYLAYAFRQVAKPVSSWTFGTVAVAALIHDLVISVGVFSIVAHFLHYEVDSSFITALLTIMGFSVHDTIVVFDRIRENLLKNRVNSAEEFEALADQSLSETLNRSLSTSLTVIVTLTALVVLGGESIRPFVTTLLIGITIGTYSSIFTATPLLALWQTRLFRRNRS
ncbi:MAG TPA: protein translocase subunit SecF [Candidatus Saccharimonadales bacterium]|nr:protein translocase subunit SecF [Candidatus Saccharimonadales bacterium]